MICTAENTEFIEKILQMRPKEVKELLSSEDEKYILRKKQEIIRNMPEILKPEQNEKSQTENFIKTFYDSNFSNQKKGTKQVNVHFPFKFEESSRNYLLTSKHKESKENLTENFKDFIPKVNNNYYKFESGIKGEFSVWKGEKLPESDPEEVLLSSEVKTIKIEESELKNVEQALSNKNDISFKREEKNNENEKNEELLEDQVELGQEILNLEEKNKSKIENPFFPVILQQSKNSPFISNKTNFLDLHTNKKSNSGNYLSPEVYSMNMLQYAHNKKRENTFDDRYSYPNVIMGGSGNGWMKTAQEMRENPFQKTFVSGLKGFANTNQINFQTNFDEVRNSAKVEANNRFRENVMDTLKYTLGDRRYTATIPERNNEEKIIENYRTSGFEGLMKKEPAQGRTKILENPFVRRPASTYKN